MTTPENEEFRLWKDPKLRDAIVHFIIGFIAVLIVAVPALSWYSQTEFKWVGNILYEFLIILISLNIVLLIKLYLVRKDALSDPRSWKIRYLPEKLTLDQRLYMSTEEIRKKFHRWKNAERRAWIYSIIFGIFAIFFYYGIMSALYAPPDEEGSILENAIGAGIGGAGLLIVGIWFGCYLLLFENRRAHWCFVLQIKSSHVKYLLEYPKEQYIPIKLLNLITESLSEDKGPS